MSAKPFLKIDHVDKIFPLGGGKEYVALRNVQLDIREN
jgi:nitrate/nitrite transport system ATP-binding protein